MVIDHHAPIIFPSAYFPMMFVSYVGFLLFHPQNSIMHLKTVCLLLTW